MDNLTLKLQSLLDGFGNKNNGRIERRYDGFYHVSQSITAHLVSDNLDSFGDIAEVPY